jgi:hypothetical protein
MNFKETNFWELLQWLGNCWFLKELVTGHGGTKEITGDRN